MHDPIRLFLTPTSLRFTFVLSFVIFQNQPLSFSHDSCPVSRAAPYLLFQVSFDLPERQLEKGCSNSPGLSFRANKFRLVDMTTLPMTLQQFRKQEDVCLNSFPRGEATISSYPFIKRFSKEVTKRSCQTKRIIKRHILSSII